MSPIAQKTAWIVFFIVSVTFAYGKGHQHGRAAQLTMNQVIEICEAQYFQFIKQKNNENVKQATKKK